MNVATMVAGREMDALVAEKVMGWYLVGDMWCKGANSYAAQAAPIEGCQKVWSPSTDIADAMQVKDKMRADRFSFTLFEFAGRVVRWVSFICSTGPCEKHGNFQHNHHGSYDVEADTVPLAICRAALVALKISPEKS